MKSRMIPLKAPSSCFTVAKCFCSALGFTLLKTGWGDYKLHHPATAEMGECGYFTEWLDDAVGVAKLNQGCKWERAMLREQGRWA